jgi:hypothetical protein
MQGVSCAGSTCFAVGYGQVNGGFKTAIRRWDGSHWSALPSPNAANRYGSALFDVACTSATDCFAVGGSWKKGQPPKDYGTLVERWNGKKWAIVKTPNVGYVSTLTCKRAANCFIGTSLRWNGKVWSHVNSKYGASGESCANATSCISVNGGPAATHWNGKTWSTGPSAKPERNPDRIALNDVACTSTTNCFALGSETEGVSDFWPVAQRWNGKNWTVMPIPDHFSVFTGDVYGVSCSGPKNCFGVGSYDTSGFGYRDVAFTVHWNGTAWSIVPAAHPSGRQSVLVDVSCVSTANCVAVGVSNAPLDGSHGSYIGPDRALFEHWDGAAWSIV